MIKWQVAFHPAFREEFLAFPQEVQDELLAEARFVEMFGPETGRPHVDTLKGSAFKNMKELRFEAVNGEWRCAFAFDPKRQALLLVCGDKTGDKAFYRRLIQKADARFEEYLASLSDEQPEAEKSGKGTKSKGKKGKRR